MQDSKGFDLWADGYDQSVQLSEEANAYPFAGYKTVLNTIYQAVRKKTAAAVLDIGFGTAVLTRKLYADGDHIYGIDFSENMIRIAQEKMPDATLIQWDFTRGLPDQLADVQFDFIICTYAIHHLDDSQKAKFLQQLLQHLTPGGQILIGDVAFQTRDELLACKELAGSDWDDDEIYPLLEQLRKPFPAIEYVPIS